MKKGIYFLVILLLFLSVSSIKALAQPRVTLCENYTTSGQPIAANTEWLMKPTGGGVYILYNNNGVPIQWPKLYVLIDREINGSYEEYATESFAPDQTKSWAVYDYRFHDKGTFKVRIADEQLNPLAERIIEIRFDNEGTEQEGATASVSFCLGIDENENPSDVSESFSINRENGSYIYIYIDNGKKAFETTGLIVDIWKGENYDEYVTTKNLTVESQWIATYFKYTFVSAGEYKFMVYRSDGTSITNGYVSINYK